MISYRNLNLHTLNTPEYSHVKLLLYWPIYGLAFLTLERLLPAWNIMSFNVRWIITFPSVKLFLSHMNSGLSFSSAWRSMG